jgi:hypothetical protein
MPRSVTLPNALLPCAPDEEKNANVRGTVSSGLFGVAVFWSPAVAWKPTELAHTARRGAATTWAVHDASSCAMFFLAAPPFPCEVRLG